MGQTSNIVTLRKQPQNYILATTEVKLFLHGLKFLNIFERSLNKKGFVSVLLAERSDFLRGHIKGVLQAAGMKTVAVNSRKDALAKLKTQVFQLVISGLELADSDGFMLASSIQNDQSIPPTLLLSISSHNLDSNPQKNLFTAHISGYDKDVILETLHNVLDHNSVISPL